MGRNVITPVDAVAIRTFPSTWLLGCHLAGSGVWAGARLLGAHSLHLSGIFIWGG